MVIGSIAAFYYTGRPGTLRDPRIKVVSIKLSRGTEVRPAMAGCDGSRSEEFSHMVARLHPYAAVNGTYYDERMKPIGDILIDGKLVNRGRQRNAIAVTKSGNVVFIRRGRRGFDWSGFRAGLAAGPRLVHDGRIALDPLADGFSRDSLTIRAWRSGVGLAGNGRLLLVTAKKPLTLSQFARVMLDLGAVEALNLDGGGACGLCHLGKTLALPTVPMTNLLVIYKSRE